MPSKRTTNIGRPRLENRDELRDRKLEIRLSARELEQLQQAAPAGLSTWAREILLRAANRGR